jgi:hypothetical protein
MVAVASVLVLGGLRAVAMQSSLATMKHGAAAGPLSGIKVGNDPSAKTTALVKNSVHHLNAPTRLREYNIARHHCWHLNLLQDLHPVARVKKDWNPASTDCQNCKNIQHL